MKLAFARRARRGPVVLLLARRRRRPAARRSACTPSTCSSSNTPTTCRSRPDGSRIVYVRVSHDIMTDRARRNLWIVNADGTNNRPLRSEAQEFQLAALVAGRHAPRVRVGRRRQPAAVRALDGLRPDRAAHQSRRGAGRDRLVARWQVDRLHAARAARQEAARSQRRRRSPRARNGRRRSRSSTRWSTAPMARAISKPGFQHVFVVSAEGGTPRQLTDGDFNDDGPLSFTPDGKHIVFSANRGADWERDPQESEVFTRGHRDAEAHAAHHARRPGQFARGLAGRAGRSPTWASTTGCRATRSLIYT